MQIFSPITIPIKGIHKNESMTNFDPIRTDNIIDEMCFLYISIDWLPVKILIIELLGDFMRISPRFFMTNGTRDTSKYF